MTRNWINLVPKFLSSVFRFFFFSDCGTIDVILNPPTVFAVSFIFGIFGGFDFQLKIDVRLVSSSAMA